MSKHSNLKQKQYFYGMPEPFNGFIPLGPDPLRAFRFHPKDPWIEDVLKKINEFLPENVPPLQLEKQLHGTWVMYNEIPYISGRLLKQMKH